MNQDDVFYLARKAGLPFHQYVDKPLFLPAVERFAALVAAAEREACAKACDVAKQLKWDAVLEGDVVPAVDCAAEIRARASVAPAPEILPEVDLSRCPNCGGVADQGFDREFPPNAYWCSRCTKELG